MKLSNEQLVAFNEQGCCFFPNCFSEDEIALLRAEADAALKLDRTEVWREKTGAPRTAISRHSFRVATTRCSNTRAPVALPRNKKLSHTFVAHRDCSVTRAELGTAMTHIVICGSFNCRTWRLYKISGTRERVWGRN
jgi:hypothetical protein